MSNKSRRPAKRKIKQHLNLEDVFNTPEMLKLLSSNLVFVLELKAGEALFLIGLLQVALRHPANRGDAAVFGRAIIQTLEASLAAEADGVRMVIEAGWC